MAAAGVSDCAEVAAACELEIFKRDLVGGGEGGTGTAGAVGTGGFSDAFVATGICSPDSRRMMSLINEE